MLNKRSSSTALQMLERMHSLPLLEDFVRRTLCGCVTEDTLELFDNIIIEMKSGNTKIFSVLHKLFLGEENPVEQVFFGALSGSKIRDTPFVCRLYLYFQYPKLFKTLICGYKEYTCAQEALLNILFLLKHEGLKQKAKTITKLLDALENDDRSAMLVHFHGYISEDEYVRFLDDLDIARYSDAVSKLAKADLYRCVSARMLRMTMEECIHLLNRLKSVENTILYANLVEVFTSGYAKVLDFNVFERFTEFFRVLSTTDTHKYEMLQCWLRLFILHQQYEHFLRVFLKIRSHETAEMAVYTSFYECILRYKQEHVFDFEKFAESCVSTEDRNAFTKIPLSKLGSMYRFSAS